MLNLCLSDSALSLRTVVPFNYYTLRILPRVRDNSAPVFSETITTNVGSLNFR